MKRMVIPFSLAALGAAIFFAPAAHGDEGMWLFNNPPKKLLADKYGFDPGNEWYEHLQRASVRFNSGGSGSFISSDGLVLTNHHVGADALQKLSSKDKDYLAAGFHAKTRAEEIKCLDLELNVLVSIEDVTAEVNAAVKPDMSMADAEKARRAVMNTIEERSTKKTGLRSDVVTLYHGGLYHLYRFKKYTDVRLVFAPEHAIAFFGGDPDNFEYPRYDLDVCFFRVYEDDKPAKIEHFLKWNHAGAGDGELVFVSGHPGRTDRLDTVAHLEFLRDRAEPATLQRIFRHEVLLRAYSERGVENARRALDDLFGVENARKAYIGRLAGLQDPAVMDAKWAAEKAFRDAVEKDPKLRETAGTAWDDVAKAIGVWEKVYTQSVLLERGAAFSCELFRIARTLVRMAEEDTKPNADRLREYRQSNRESIEQSLFSEAPIYNDLEIVKLADSLSFLVEQTGVEDGLVEWLFRRGGPVIGSSDMGMGMALDDLAIRKVAQKVLAGKSPGQRAAELVQGTTLADVAVRRKLAEGGQAAIESSKDPMIQLARLVDAPSRAVRKITEQEIDEPLRQAYAKLATAQFAVRGTDVYPDATFTLRLAFGTVRGYTELGTEVPPWTTIGGAFEHAAAHANREPFALPQSWTDRKDRLKLMTPLNFVSTVDIIGGNSGSPVVDRQGQFVGIIFDGNLQSLVWDFVYTAQEGRATSVHSAVIEEALRKIYDADALADELGR